MHAGCVAAVDVALPDGFGTPAAIVDARASVRGRLDDP
jgi:hypothetical protein